MSFSLIQAFDILIIAYILFLLYKLLRGTASVNLVFSIIVLFLVYQGVAVLGMKMTSILLNQIFDVGLLALLVIFQPEVRRFLFYVFKNTSKQLSFFNRILQTPTDQQSQDSEKEIAMLLQAVDLFKLQKTGALIVLCPPNTDMSEMSKGVYLDAKLSTDLLETIFQRKSPMHDGAAVVRNGRIVSASCVLPVSNSPDLPQWAGLRHRAALGVSEIYSVAVIIVSEESGKCSFAHDGALLERLDTESLTQLLQKHYR